MSGSNEQQQQQQQPDLNALIQQMIRQQMAAASGQQQVQLPSLPAPQAQTQYSNDPSQGPDLLARIGLALGGGSLPGAPAELRQQMGKQALLNFGIGLMSAGRFASPGEVLAGGLRGAQGGLLGREAALAGQQEYALNAQTKMAELAAQQQKNRTEALTALVPLLQLQGRMGLPPLFGGGGGPGGGGGGGGAGSDTVFNGDPEHDLPLIAQRESGGDPKALNYVAKADPTAYDRGATASGKYQIVNSTWREGMQLAGLDPAQYATAMSAPEAVQDKVAQALYAKYGTRPWDASKFGANWVQQPGGGYQLVKGAQPPATAPGSAVGPYKVASTGNVAPPSAQPSSGLPEPPVPPVGAVPTVSTPEEATATAKAAGTPVQVPGGQGLWAKPEGGVTTTPNLIMPGTQVAGPVVPPAGTEQPPAATPGTPPAQPPAQPAQPPTHAPDLTARNDDGSFVVPNDKLSLPDYQQRFRHVPTAEELTQRGLVIPGNEAEAQAAARGVQEAETAAAAAQRAANLAMQPGYNQSFGTVAELLKANTEAQAKAQAAREKYADMLQDTTKTNAAALQKYYEKQDSDLAANYKAEVLDPRNAAALETQRGETQKDIERIKTGAELQRSLMQPDLDRLKTMGTQSDEMTNLAVNLQQLRAILPNLPDAGWGAAIAQHLSPAAMGWMQAAGLGDPKQMNAVQALNGLAAYLSVQMRPTGSGALRNQEMDRFMQALPNLAQGAAGREKAVAFLLNYANRVQDENQFANEYFHRPKADGSPALNLIGVERAMNAPKSQGGLGEVVPHAPPLSAGPQAAQTFLNGIDSGRPYYAWVPKVDKSGAPIRNERGQVVYDYDLAVKP